MPSRPPAAAHAAATLPLFAPSQHSPDRTASLFRAAGIFADLLARGQVLDARVLRETMQAAFGATDAEGAWDWKLAYEATEAAQILFLRKFAPEMLKRVGSPPAFLAMLEKLAAFLPSQTRRS